MGQLLLLVRGTHPKRTLGESFLIWGFAATALVVVFHLWLIFGVGILCPHGDVGKGFASATCSSPLCAPQVPVPRLILTFPSEVPFLHI